MRRSVAVPVAVLAIGAGVVWQHRSAAPTPVPAVAAPLALAPAAPDAPPRDPSLLMAFASLKQISPLSRTADEPLRLVSPLVWATMQDVPATAAAPVRRLVRATPLPAPRPGDVVVAEASFAKADLPRAKTPRVEVFGVKLPRFVPTAGAVADRAAAVKELVADTASTVKDSVLGLFHF